MCLWDSPCNKTTHEFPSKSQFAVKMKHSGEMKKWGLVYRWTYNRNSPCPQHGVHNKTEIPDIKFPTTSTQFFCIIPQISILPIQQSAFSNQIQAQTFISLVQLSLFQWVCQLHSLRTCQSWCPQKNWGKLIFSLNALPLWCFRFTQIARRLAIDLAMSPHASWSCGLDEIAGFADWTSNLNSPKCILVSA